MTSLRAARLVNSQASSSYCPLRRLPFLALPVITTIPPHSPSPSYPSILPPPQSDSLGDLYSSNDYPSSSGSQQLPGGQLEEHLHVLDERQPGPQPAAGELW